MPTWPPSPDVPAVIDQPFPEDFGPGQPQPFEVIDGTQPQPVTAVPPWEQQFPEQQLSSSLEAPLGADPTAPLGQPQEVEGPPREQEGPPWEAEQPAAQNDNGPWWAKAAQGAVGQSATPENALRQAGQRNEAERQADPEAYATMEQYRLKASAEKQQAEGDLRLAQEYKAQLQQDQLKEARDNAIAADAEAKVGQAWDEVRNAKIDPGAMWGSMGTGQKVTAILGAAIGGFLSARQQTGRNQFMDTYNQRVAESIHAQEANLANMRAAAQGQQSVYGMMLDRFKDAKTARFMTAATLYEAGKQELGAQVSQHKSQITQQDGILAMTQLDKQRDANLAAAKQSQFDQGLKVLDAQQAQQKIDEERRNNKAQTGLGYSRLAEEKRQNATENTLKAAEIEQKRLEAGPKAVPIYGKGGPQAGPIGYASDAKPAEEARAMASGNAELDVLYKRGKELLRTDYATAGSDRRLQIEQWNEAWQSARFRASGRTDAPSAGELQRWGIDPSRVWGDNEVALDESYNTSKMTGAAKLRAAGVPDTSLRSEGYLDPVGFKAEGTNPTSDATTAKRKKDEERTQKVEKQASEDVAGMVTVYTSRGPVLMPRSQLEEGSNALEIAGGGGFVSLDDMPTGSKFKLKHGVPGMVDPGGEWMAGGVRTEGGEWSR